jgi:V/A-type H+-transporting ATPase subunit A
MKTNNIGTITTMSGNLITVAFTDEVRQNEIAYVLMGSNRLKSEVIRIQGSHARLQVYEETRGLKVGDQVAFSGELLSVKLGPGLLGQVFDGLQCIELVTLDPQCHFQYIA